MFSHLQEYAGHMVHPEAGHIHCKGLLGLDHLHKELQGPQDHHHIHHKVLYTVLLVHHRTADPQVEPDPHTAFLQDHLGVHHLHRGYLEKDAVEECYPLLLDSPVNTALFSTYTTERCLIYKTFQLAISDMRLH